MTHLEPVTDFSALRMLLRVLVKECRYCGRSHEVTLTHLEERRHHTTEGRIDWGVVWMAEPRPECAKFFGAPFSVARLTVDQGRVFVIVDDADAAATPARARKPEMVE